MEFSSQVSLINTLGSFCSNKSVQQLTKPEISSKFGIVQIDIAVLFGGSIIAGGDLFASLIQQQVANYYVIVGGYGHTTETLFNQMTKLYPHLEFNHGSEAELFNDYLRKVHSVQADYLETKSTNCGNNVTNFLQLVEEKKLSLDSLLFIQDATMQRRMDLTFQKHLPDTTRLISYPAYEVEVIESNNQLIFNEDIVGMWSMEHYISLLLGEIPRLRDDKEGYGPKGKNFLAHCDIPDDVEEAFQTLSSYYPDSIRQANPDFSS